ncbi:MAG: NYN domain-containing protein [Prevotella sp.]|nr:NYN domain-containing protein [Prevotella sp.]
MTENKKELTLAVLFDADNVPYSHVEEMLNEIAKYGVPTIKRIYGDWTKPNLAGWKAVLLENAITPIQQYSYTTGKNATDSAMIIDAMDILHSNKADGFCIISSDSDFTRLATRLRESSKLVIGMGERKTPRPFIVACDKFIYIENLGNDDEETQQDEATVQEGATVQEPLGGEEKKAAPAKEKISYSIIKLLRKTIDDLADDNEWVSLAEVGSLLLKKRPDFDPRNYGFSKLTPLIESCPRYFEIEKRKAENSHVVHVFVRMRKGR